MLASMAEREHLRRVLRGKGTKNLVNNRCPPLNSVKDTQVSVDLTLFCLTEGFLRHAEGRRGAWPFCAHYSAVDDVGAWLLFQSVLLDQFFQFLVGNVCLI